LFLLLVTGNAGAAEPIPERFLPLDGKISDDGTRIEINWTKATGSNVDRVSVQRRILGETFKASWQDIATLRSFARVYVDEDVQPGIAYEYRISRPSKEQIETGYWVTGRNLPAADKRGVALVIVDETLAAELAAHLDRFMLDLSGDGWRLCATTWCVEMTKMPRQISRQRAKYGPGFRAVTIRTRQYRTP
jgi:hypothetical protein